MGKDNTMEAWGGVGTGWREAMEGNWETSLILSIIKIIFLKI